MKAIAIEPGKKQQLFLVDYPQPSIEADEVLVQTLSVGVDATDRDIYQGKYGEAPPGERLLITGHEAVGQVVSAGSKVKNFSPGDYVVPTVRRGCESCWACTSNQVDMCQTENYLERGIKAANGYMSEFFKEKEENLVKLPANLVNYGALVEPASIVQKAIIHGFAIQKRFKWRPASALVLGAGSLGLLATAILSTKGLATYALDIAEEDSPKAMAASEAGATYVNGKKVTLENFPERHQNPDLIIEATGNSKVAFSAMHIINQNGVLALLSVAAGNHRNEICTDCLNNKLVLGNKVVFGSSSSNKYHFQKAIEALSFIVKNKPSFLRRIISRRLDLASYREAYEPKEPAIKSVIYFKEKEAT